MARAHVAAHHVKELGGQPMQTPFGATASVWTHAEEQRTMSLDVALVWGQFQPV